MRAKADDQGMIGIRNDDDVNTICLNTAVVDNAISQVIEQGGNSSLAKLDVTDRDLRNSKTDLAIPMLRIGNGQKSFAYRGASLWNSLDLDTKMAPTINAFKFKLKEK